MPTKETKEAKERVSEATRATPEVKADATAEAEGKRPTETVPGGRYKVGDQFVNSEGEKVK